MKRYTGPSGSDQWTSLMPNAMILYIFVAHSAAPGWWTSGTFMVRTKQWMWSAHLYVKPFTFIKWARDEPNEAMVNEDMVLCMYLDRADDHAWHDHVCTRRYNFICETTVRAV
jgi:hypothetical protein